MIHHVNSFQILFEKCSSTWKLQLENVDLIESNNRGNAARAPAEKSEGYLKGYKVSGIINL
jgi:hypothetical protein